MSEPRYRFGPLERRGVLIGLRLPQLGALALAGLVMVATARSLPPAAAVSIIALVGIVAVAVVFVPIAGRSVDEWIPIAASWLATGIASRRSFRSALPVVGDHQFESVTAIFPPSMRGVSLICHQIPGTPHEIGVVKDARTGTFTGVLVARGETFALLEVSEQGRRLAAWASILSSLAREGSPVARLQWIDRTVTDSGDEMGEHLRRNLSVPIDSPLARSYLEVLDEAGSVTHQHEAFVVLQIDAGRSARAVKAAGGGDRGACDVLYRELTALSRALQGCDIHVDGALTPRLLAQAIRNGFDPSGRKRLLQVKSRSPERAGTSVANAAPMASEAGWSSYRADNSWHATYWIAEWPRVEVGPDFLAPLMLRAERMRTVSVTMEPVQPLRAIRAVEAARTSAAADEELRARAGFAATARRTREQESLADHERDLSAGHAFYRFSGYVTVTARDPEELEKACGEIEEAAGRSLLDIRRLWGQQDTAFTYTLPLCRGLR